MGSARVAGVTRARALRTRRLGADGVREVAACRTLDDALHYLTATAYRHDVTPGGSLAEAQRAVTATLLWHLRILAGWQSADGAGAVRALAAGFEISNAEGHLRTLVEPDPDQGVATAPDRERRDGNPPYPDSLSPGRRSPP
ncbi:V-type ATPase subunit, partial [Streptomyces scabiei]|uniref:V-type ATPase subunit n=2 Tax=Streptomyces TaxID=1883 RepID=UPI0015C50862